jgi:transcription antitermination factor NusA-like protein
MNELSGEKIDIIEWSADPIEFVQKALSPAKVLDISLDEEEHKATIEVSPDQLSLAIGKGGQNVRLAAKLTGWKIDIKGTDMPAESVEEVASLEGDDFKPLSALVANDEDKAEEILSEVQDLETPVETDNESNLEGITTGEIITNEIEGKE